MAPDANETVELPHGLCCPRNRLKIAPPKAPPFSVFLFPKDRSMALQDKYINPFTDFGFKKLFGSEPNKDLLIDFLNQVLPGKHKIKDLTYARTEQLGNSEADRNAIFDLYCVGENGERFIVEMQEESLKYYRDLKNVADTSFDEGKAEGKAEIARQMKAKGMDSNLISEITGLSVDAMQV